MEFAVYMDENGNPLKWSANFPLPEIGSRVYIILNRIGWAVVKGYFAEAGYLGVMTLATNPPKWLRDQRKRNQKDPRFVNSPDWVKEGIGCEFGAEIQLNPPAGAQTANSTISSEARRSRRTKR